MPTPLSTCFVVRTAQDRSNVASSMPMPVDHAQTHNRGLRHGILRDRSRAQPLGARGDRHAATFGIASQALRTRLTTCSIAAGSAHRRHFVGERGSTFACEAAAGADSPRRVEPQHAGRNTWRWLKAKAAASIRGPLRNTRDFTQSLLFRDRDVLRRVTARALDDREQITTCATPPSARPRALRIDERRRFHPRSPVPQSTPAPAALPLTPASHFFASVCIFATLPTRTACGFQQITVYTQPRGVPHENRTTAHATTAATSSFQSCTMLSAPAPRASTNAIAPADATGADLQRLSAARAVSISKRASRRRRRPVRRVRQVRRSSWTAGFASTIRIRSIVANIA